MKNEGPSYSRYNRFEKKRRNTKWLSIFIILGLILIIIFFGVFVFSTPDEDDVALDPNTSETDQEEDLENSEDGNENDDVDQNPQDIEDERDAQDDLDDEQETNETPNEPERDIDVDPEKEELESGEDNVLRSYRSNWDPIPTEQAEPHEITWDQSTIDWEEKLKAAELATSVRVEDMKYLWVSGDGPQGVITTFSSPSLNEHYRVYIRWIENQGWQPQRVDELMVHDLMDNFN